MNEFMQDMNPDFQLMAQQQYNNDLMGIQTQVETFAVTGDMESAEEQAKVKALTEHVGKVSLSFVELGYDGLGDEIARRQAAAQEAFIAAEVQKLDMAVIDGLFDGKNEKSKKEKVAA